MLLLACTDSFLPMWILQRVDEFTHLEFFRTWRILVPADFVTFAASILSKTDKARKFKNSKAPYGILELNFILIIII
jgi:hypothetical protein